MIESLHIEDLGVIEEAELTLSPGLTALTGETGAGKTMVLTSLGLLLGQRAESTVVRAGAQRAVVEGSFVLDPTSRAGARAQEAGAELDEDVLIASRTVPAQGRSRAYLGGRTVPSTVLAEVGTDLVSVHGQADQLRLRSASAQRAALDSLGGEEHLDRCRAYARSYRAYQEAVARQRQWREGAAARAQEVALLRGWLEAIEQLDPAPGEDAALTEEAVRLDHAEDLRRAATVARTALAGDDEAMRTGEDVLALLSEADRAISPATGMDRSLEELGARVHHLSIEAADVAAELGEYLAGLDADPARLAWVQDRRGELARAFREIGGPEEEIEDADALLAFSQRAAERLATLDGPTDAGASLAEEVERAQESLRSCARGLSAARERLAQLLQERVTAELEGLQMRGSRLVVALEALEEPGPTGAESVTLQLVSHPGAPALALGKGASGGELSRIMLALEVVLAESSQAGDRRTLVFDEIDAGVGGRAAGEIGRRLARLARTHQVVVVTHLAQVAAWADTQLVVRKEQPQPGRGGEGEVSNGVVAGLTRTTVLAVEGSQRVRELARMLAGHDDSDSALRHAAELLEEAHVAESQA
ncbi:DNA repair protein RecN [Actinomyces faecalis]|uniref:DNA repair protein RecN n=1 Tax=Actinomyces faecalis TaxID=2722820 RepID=UPI00155518E5|nr:DNA repair protein RecN [Actinomyces faecalis]